MLFRFVIQGYIEIASLFFYLFIIVINRTLRIKIVGAEHYYALKSRGKKIAFVFWHQATFVLLYLYRNSSACILTMKSLRGEVLGRAGERLGYQVIRLSTEDDAAGFREMLRRVRKGHDSNIAVDGPAGPLFQMKPGAIFLAIKLGNPILPVAVAASPAWVLSWRWDKYFIPLPFARAAVVFGEPIYPSEKKVEPLRASCEKTLIELTGRAKKAVEF